LFARVNVPGTEITWELVDKSRGDLRKFEKIFQQRRLKRQVSLSRLDRTGKLCFIVLEPTGVSQDTQEVIRENLAVITMDDNGGLPINAARARARARGSRAVLRVFASRRATPRGRFPPTSEVATSQSAESCKSTGCDSSEDEGAPTTTRAGLVSRRGLITISAIARDSAHLETRIERVAANGSPLRSSWISLRAIFSPITLESQLELRSNWRGR